MMMDTDFQIDKPRLIDEIKRNYELAALCCVPFIEQNFHRVSQIASKLGISESKFLRYSTMLLNCEVWKRSGAGVIPDFDPLDLGDITVTEFLSMTVHIISRISNERPSQFETMTIASNRPLVAEFNKQVNKALKELYEKSQELEERQCLFSWTHAGLIEYEKNAINKVSED